MSQTADFQKTLRRLAVFDEELAGAGFGPCPTGWWPGWAGSFPPPQVATALEYDVEAALEECGDQ